MGFTLHANNTDDPPAVRNWRIHMMAIIASMGSVASMRSNSFPFALDFVSLINVYCSGL